MRTVGCGGGVSAGRRPEGCSREGCCWPGRSPEVGRALRGDTSNTLRARRCRRRRRRDRTATPQRRNGCGGAAAAIAGADRREKRERARTAPHRSMLIILNQVFPALIRFTFDFAPVNPKARGAFLAGFRAGLWRHDVIAGGQLLLLLRLWLRLLLVVHVSGREGKGKAEEEEEEGMVCKSWDSIRVDGG
ncbi:hypothetical protein PLESTM_001440500 [Pleodorina starrii]|nr:hypothetical protein PLESTM_001440500 [Pleodorina starrii]